MLLWMPIWFHYQEVCGLSARQSLDIQSAYYLSFCLLELPTGYLADRLGHRGCLRWGAALHILTNFLPVVWTTAGGFLAHWLLLALSRSLVSGAASAWLYNRLEALGESKHYKPAESGARAWSLAAKAGGFVLTDLLTARGPALPYLVSAIASVVATVVALRMPGGRAESAPESEAAEPTLPTDVGLQAAEATAEELQVSGDTSREKSPRALGALPPPPQATSPTPAEVARTLMSNRLLQLVVLQGVAIFTLTRIVQVNLFQPLLAKAGFSATTFGKLLAVNTLFEAAGAACTSVMRRWCSDLAAVFWLTAGLAVCCAGLAMGGKLSTFGWLNLFGFLAGLAYPIQRAVMNAHIPRSDLRASLLSAESLVDRGVCAWVAYEAGEVLTGGGMPWFLQVAAAVSLAGCAVLAPAYALARRTNLPPDGGGEKPDGGGRKA